MSNFGMDAGDYVAAQTMMETDRAEDSLRYSIKAGGSMQIDGGAKGVAVVGGGGGGDEMAIDNGTSAAAAAAAATAPLITPGLISAQARESEQQHQKMQQQQRQQQQDQHSSVPIITPGLIAAQARADNAAGPFAGQGGAAAAGAGVARLRSTSFSSIGSSFTGGSFSGSFMGRESSYMDRENSMRTKTQLRRKRAFTSCGTDYYVAPEVLEGRGYNEQVRHIYTSTHLHIYISTDRHRSSTSSLRNLHIVPSSSSPPPPPTHPKQLNFCLNLNFECIR